MLHLSGTMLNSKWIEDHATSNCFGRRVTSQNKTIAVQCDDRRFESQLRQTTVPGRNLRRRFQDSYAAQHFRGANVETDS